MTHNAEKDALMKVLYGHRGDMVCYDHPESYCCTCGEHEVGGYREHLADVLLHTRPIPPADPRDPAPCPRCDEVCKYDGWGLVHTNGRGIGSCSIPPAEEQSE